MLPRQRVAASKPMTPSSLLKEQEQQQQQRRAVHVTGTTNVITWHPKRAIGVTTGHGCRSSGLEILILTLNCL